MRVSRTRPEIEREVAHIIGSAQGGITRVVGLGPLIFFSTETGDAWLLDWQDERALCLARGGTSQKANIVETENDFAIEWTSDYRIQGDVMTFQHGTGRVESIHGYPTAAILQTTQRLAGDE
jgi:hypothetical protein